MIAGCLVEGQALVEYFRYLFDVGFLAGERRPVCRSLDSFHDRRNISRQPEDPAAQPQCFDVFFAKDDAAAGVNDGPVL